MRDLAPGVMHTLDVLAPDVAERGDWDSVLRDAAPRRRPRRRRGALLAVAAAVVGVACAAALLAWPATHRGPSFADRALAAAGNGPVLHAVLEGPYSHPLVDLRTGKRQALRPRQELWFDHSRGFHTIERFQGAVQISGVARANRISPADDALYREFATGYREALASGRATEVGDETIDGVDVTWIRVSTTTYTNPSTGKAERVEQQVAISRETFEPVYLRTARDGKPEERALYTRVVRFETLPAGRGVFTGPPLGDSGVSFGGVGPSGDTLDAAQAKARLGGRTPLWPGATVAGLPLVHHGTFKGLANWSQEERRWRTQATGVVLAYGTPAGDGTWIITRKRHLELYEFTRMSDGMMSKLWLRGYVPPAGKLLVVGRGTGLLRTRGLIVLVVAENQRVLVETARALRPWTG
jgi:hypothetical protein